MKVFIWGSYNYANFGDDLMAVIIGRHAVSSGCEVKVFGLHPEICKQHGLSPEVDCESGVEWADCVVLGGGAVFGQLVGNQAVKDAYDADIGTLVDALETYRKRAVALSVGVGATKAETLWTKNQVRLLECPLFEGGTVRLKSDADALAQFAKFHFVPDILFTMADVVAISPTRELEWLHWNLPRVTKTARLELIISRFLGALGRFKTNWLSVYGQQIPAELSRTATQEVLPSNYVAHQDPLELAERLASQPGIVISSKLHLGITSLALGSIFISVKGKSKTRRALEELGLEKYCQSVLQVGLSLLGMRGQAKRHSLSAEIADALEPIRAEARRHWVCLDQFLVSIQDEVYHESRVC